MGKLTDPFNKPEVKNSHVEGENRLKKITPIKINILKLLLNILISLTSAGVWLLFLYWSPKIRKDCIYDECEIQNAT